MGTDSPTGVRHRPLKGSEVSISFSVHRSGQTSQETRETTTTGLDLFGDDREVVAMKVNG